MATGSIKAKRATIESTTVTVPKSQVQTGTFVQAYEENNLESGYIHFFIVVATCTAGNNVRFLLNMSPGGQLEGTNTYNQSGYSALGVVAVRGTGSNSQIFQYRIGSTPTSDITFEITHIKIPE